MGVITIRRSRNQDLDAIGRLAALDSRHEPRGEALLAFEGEELVAALPLDGGEAIADPFHTRPRSSTCCGSGPPRPRRRRPCAAAAT